ncbi:MAG: hypothetical protein KDK70_13535 [Myxococcales bacterium]|nr:hypothetical protein [Myxococcales bacterium]
MTLRLAASNDAPEGPGGPRILAPGAPPSPGPVPSELARHLTFGEALVWWGDKDRIHFGPIVLVLVAAVSILGFVSLLAPEFWLQPWEELWKPVAALLSPCALVLVRERLNQRAVLVTDTSITEVEPRGEAQRLALDGIVAVRRDLLRGGLVLLGRRGRVRIPPSLLDDAHQAIASQQRGRVRAAGSVDDPTGWLP